MEARDFKVFLCPDCKNRDGMYYMPPLSKDETLRKMELNEFKEDFGIEFDGKNFHAVCDKCGKKMHEVPFEQWTTEELREAIGNMLEDDNRHSSTNIGWIFDDCMKSAGIEKEKRADALRAFAERYSKTHSLQ